MKFSFALSFIHILEVKFVIFLEWVYFLWIIEFVQEDKFHPRRLYFQHKIKASYFLSVWDIHWSSCWICEKSAFFKNLLYSKLKWWRQRPHRFRTVYWNPVRVLLLNHSIVSLSHMVEVAVMQYCVSSKIWISPLV